MRELRSRTDPALAPLTDEMCHLVAAAGAELIIEYLADPTSTLPELAPESPSWSRLVVIPNYQG